MSEFFASGRVIDLVLVVVVIEVIALSVWPRLRGSMSLVDVASLIAPGVMLMLVIRNEMTQGPYTITAALLAAAFVCHLIDLYCRRQSARKESN